VTSEHEIGDRIVLRVVGTIEGTATADGEIRAHQVRLDVGGLIGLTPERLAAAADSGRALDFLLGHVRTGEPLSEDEVSVIVSAGLCEEGDFDHTGGGLYRHRCLRDGDE
jgi:hypothetical protein